MNSEDSRDVYLPEGKWVQFFTGERLTGNQWIHLENIPLEQMPVYVREGAQIPMYPEHVECTDEMDLQKTIIVTIDEQFKGFNL